MKQLFTLLACCLLFQISANAQCSDIFFSEYIEGSSSNKAIEIYNPTSAPINLGDYKINRYNGGSTSVSGDFTFPAIMLGAGEVYVIANANADSLGVVVISDTTSDITFYNGDDALELVKSGSVIDVIGLVGDDPGTSWPVDTGSTANYTLVRKITVNEGQPNWTIGAGQWDVYEEDNFSFLGRHTINACTVGLNEINSLKGFSVFPNPTNGILNVALQFESTESVQLEITDLLGRNVFTLQQEQIITKTYQLNPDIPSGVYFLKVKVGNRIAVETFVVE